MRLINADRLKIDYKSKIVANLIDSNRGIDLSHYVEDFCINFNKLVDNQPTVNVFDKIRAEIEQLPITDTAIRLVTEIIDKYKAESEEE